VLLDRAFQSVLQRHLKPLLTTILPALDRLYPQYYRALTSPSVPPELTRLLTALFGALTIVLRAPAFNPEEKGFEQKALDQGIFSELLKFAQVSDETVNEWLANPMSIVDESAEMVLRMGVRTTVLSCAEEHLDISFATFWSQNYNSIVGEYPHTHFWGC